MAVSANRWRAHIPPHHNHRVLPSIEYRVHVRASLLAFPICDASAVTFTMCRGRELNGVPVVVHLDKGAYLPRNKSFRRPFAHKPHCTGDPHPGDAYMALSRSSSDKQLSIVPPHNDDWRKQFFVHPVAQS